MSQKPFSAEEEPEFQHALSALDALAMSSIVLGLRQVGDNYPACGWLLVGTFAPKRERHQNRELRALDTLHGNHPCACDGPEPDFEPGIVSG